MSNSKPIAVVVGASRGIGAEFVKQLNEAGYHVVATVRRPTVVLGASKVIDSIELGSDESMERAGQSVPEADLLIVNASIGDDEILLSTDSKKLNHYLDINVTGTHRAIHAFLPALRARKTRKIVVLATFCGSFEVAVNRPFPTFNGPYAVSKVALNMLAIQFHRELAKEAFTVMPIDPGWVDTDMGRLAGDPLKEGGHTPENSIKGMLKVISSIKQDDPIRVLDYAGEVIPW
ncbi:hypothetical protein GYMLUDRAFT_262741 [Collybiopsis luxurians FD-317 M1]|uniref:Uncharacterized protein n=1 Tax=Collybiopsis luxurians FD-317 M1 TaxID=944289 RepID=A0A0D0B3M6_9AGAR|nr:hypothetical protein GYMLUDRAFT_262741 [Collybiopsis luxurians FD-317 M1]